MDDEWRVLRARVAELERLASLTRDENEPGGGAFRGRWMSPSGAKVPYWQKLRINQDGSLPTSDTAGEQVHAAVLGDPDSYTPLTPFDPIVAFRYPESASGYITMGGYPVCGACYPGARNLNASVVYKKFGSDAETLTATFRLLHQGTRPGRVLTASWFQEGTNALPNYALARHWAVSSGVAFDAPRPMPVANLLLRCDTGSITVSWGYEFHFQGGSTDSGRFYDERFMVTWPIVIDYCDPFAARVLVTQPISWFSGWGQAVGQGNNYSGPHRLYGATTFPLVDPSNGFGIQSFTITS